MEASALLLGLIHERRRRGVLRNSLTHRATGRMYYCGLVTFAFSMSPRVPARERRKAYGLDTCETSGRRLPQLEGGVRLHVRAQALPRLEGLPALCHRRGYQPRAGDGGVRYRGAG